MVNLRKVVAFDMAHHGTTFIVGEFALGVLGPIGLGIFSIFRDTPPGLIPMCRLPACNRR
jgi:hypothetical protein